MLEYRKRIEGTAKSPEADAAALGSGDTEIERYMEIAAHFGLSDMEIGESPGAKQKQTIDQEYQAYITAPLENNTVNILKFWEVRG